MRGPGLSVRILLTVLTLLIFCWFIRLIPRFALREEQAFRQGSERWSTASDSGRLLHRGLRLPIVVRVRRAYDPNPCVDVHVRGNGGGASAARPNAACLFI